MPLRHCISDSDQGTGSRGPRLVQITVKARIPLKCYTLQKEEVQDVKYIHHQELLAKYEARDDQFCVADLDGGVRLLPESRWPVAERLCALMDFDLQSKTRLLCTLHARCCHLIDTVNEHATRTMQTVGSTHTLHESEPPAAIKRPTYCERSCRQTELCWSRQSAADARHLLPASLLTTAAHACATVTAAPMVHVHTSHTERKLLHPP